MNLLNFFKRKKSDTNKKHNQIENTYLDIVISLNKNLEIDLSIFLEDKYQNTNLDKFTYAMACVEFINTVVSDKLKPEVTNIIDTQIRSPINEQLISAILLLLKKTENKYLDTNNKIYIKPSQVFLKY
jgi:hypothetical protein